MAAADWAGPMTIWVSSHVWSAAEIRVRAQSECVCHGGYFALPQYMPADDTGSEVEIWGQQPNWEPVPRQGCNRTVISAFQPVCQKCDERSMWCNRTTSAPQGVTWDTLSLRAGWWQDSSFYIVQPFPFDAEGSAKPHLVSRNDHTIEFQPEDCGIATTNTFCLESANRSHWADCAGDMVGPLCGQCPEGDNIFKPSYFRNTVGECEKCMSTLIAWVVIAAIAGAVALFIATAGIMWKAVVRFVSWAIIAVKKLVSYRDMLQTKLKTMAEEKAAVIQKKGHKELKIAAQWFQFKERCY